MARAIWNGVVIAESEETVEVEGNQYFPPSSLKQEHFRETDYSTVCPWKGNASYYDVVIGENVNERAAWYYPEPKEAAERIKDHVAFWQGVTVET